MAHISIRSLSLSYPIYSVNSRSIRRNLLRLSTGGRLSADPNDVVTVKALDDINLELKEGDRVGLVGSNGAGKSTLLRVMTGIYEPTAGSIEVQGKITSILSMGLGIDRESTGYENIYIRGLFLGLTKQQIADIIPDIEEFTELGDYLNIPVKAYSSGMRLRLAFAISTSIHPEVLLIDEAIGVGDARFLAKAQQRVKDLIEKTNIFVLASHSSQVLRSMCNKALYLDHGRIKLFGDIDDVLKEYAKTFK